MNKNTLKVCLLALLALISCSKDESEPIPDLSGICGQNVLWKYYFDTNTLNISGTGDMDNFKIPWADFKTRIETIIIENGVTSIGTAVFSECKNLRKVSIPRSVININEAAFKRCQSLTTINLPISITNIGIGAFEGCKSLSSIEIPKGVRLSGKTFANCTSLTSVILHHGIEEICGFGGCTSLTSLEIPNSVTKIGYYAFEGCTSLTSLEIPNSVTTIGEGAFEGCTSLTSLEIPNSVTTIGKTAFAGCIGLSSITIPNEVRILENGTFKGCTKLQKVILSNNLESIGVDSNVMGEVGPFYDCTSLVSLHLPNSLTYIGPTSFYNCISLTSINIPENVNKIETHRGTFSKISSLSIEVDKNNQFFSSIDGVLFDKNTKLLLAYAKGKIQPNYSIPKGVESIANGSFLCDNLISVTIPSSVTRVGDAFGTSLQVAKIFANNPPICITPFMNYNIEVRVPEEALNSYKTNYGWGQYNIKPLADEDVEY